jgi:uncharacterized protein (DUF2249 family)
MRKGLVVSLSYLIFLAWGCWPTLSKQVSTALTSGAKIIAIAQTPKQGRPDRKSIDSPSKPIDPVSENPARRTANKRLKIEIDVTTPDDLLVREGQTVAANQLIVDRQSERSTLSAQLQETKLSIEKLKTTPKVSQLPPAAVKRLNSLPPKTSYGEEQAQITAAVARIADLDQKYTLAQASAKFTLLETEKVRGSKIAVRQIEEQIARHNQKIATLGTLEDIDQSVKDHEQAKLRELNRSLSEAQTKLEQDVATEGIAKAARSSRLVDAQSEITAAQRDLQLARAKLITSTEKRQQLEYDYQIKDTERGEQVQRMELERVKLQETKQLQAHDRDYQIAQLVLKQRQIQKQLGTIGVVRTPHQGTIRRVKLVAQHGNLLRYEIALVYALTSKQSDRPVSQWQEDKDAGGKRR